MTAGPPQSAASSPDDGGTPICSATLAKRERVPRRTVGACITSLGTPVGIWVLCPVLGEVIAAIEVAAMLTIIATALFGSLALSERAFRLLRWLGDRPEPPSPAPNVRPPAHSGSPTYWVQELG